MEQVLHAEYASALADHWWFRGRRRIFATLLDGCVPLARGSRILEVGPGHGVNLEVLLPRGRVTVLDTERDSLAACLRRGAAGGALADATSPPFANASFDLACALDVLEHLEDDRAGLRALFALLKPGAHLFVTVPALSILWGRQDVLSRHFRRYGRNALAERIESAGFVIEKLSFFNSILFLPILLLRLCMRPFLARSTRSGSGSDFSVRTPGFLSSLCYRLFAAEARWLLRHRLPIGVSLLCIARKPGS